MNYSPENILFIDIETVSNYAEYHQLPENFALLWRKKYEKNEYLKSSSIEESYSQKAAIFAEYGKIICVSVGIYDKLADSYRIKSFANHEESSLLGSFVQFCNELKRKYIFCGHNIREFDIPYISRRCLINRLSIPSMMDFQDKKPWEIDMIDTMQYWKFGDYKNFTSLETLTTLFHIPTPKEDIDGSQVGQIYWIENNLQRIVEYCQRDVVALIQLYRCFQRLEILDNTKFSFIS